jgi:hypothetical protein
VHGIICDRTTDPNSNAIVIQTQPLTMKRGTGQTPQISAQVAACNIIAEDVE